MALLPADKRASIAVDLGAESCRVSLLRWVDGKAEITLVHRFANAPREVNGGLYWDLEMIEAARDLFRPRFVVRRSASDCREDVCVGEMQSIIRMS